MSSTPNGQPGTALVPVVTPVVVDGGGANTAGGGAKAAAGGKEFFKKAGAHMRANWGWYAAGAVAAGTVACIAINSSNKHREAEMDRAAAARAQGLGR